MTTSKCYCYEKFKDRLPKDFETKCFRENCNNWRSHNETTKGVNQKLLASNDKHIQWLEQDGKL